MTPERLEKLEELYERACERWPEYYSYTKNEWYPRLFIGWGLNAHRKPCLTIPQLNSDHIDEIISFLHWSWQPNQIIFKIMSECGQWYWSAHRMKDGVIHVIHSHITHGWVKGHFHLKKDMKWDVLLHILSEELDGPTHYEQCVCCQLRDGPILWKHV